VWQFHYVGRFAVTYDDLILNYDTNSRTMRNRKLKAAYAIEMPSYSDEALKKMVNVIAIMLMFSILVLFTSHSN
jgi:hypothetical protein